MSPKYLYHAGNEIHSIPKLWGEGYHYTDDLEDLKLSMLGMRDKSIIIQYPVKKELKCLDITGDMDGWFGPSLAELLLAKLDNRKIEDDFVSTNPVNIKKLNINVKEEDREELQSIKDSYDNSEESFNKVFSILNKYGYNCIRYDYYEGSSKAFCLADISLLDLSNAKIVYRKK